MAQPAEAPFRTPPPECSACKEREEARKTMLPFVEGKDRHCPECLTESPLIYKVVCQGNNHTFVANPGVWFFFWRIGRRTFTCKTKNAPKHFHLECRLCEHRWKMLTATEPKP